MALTSKSPTAVALAALATARRSLSAYSHECSPKVFTQHQLFACLVLKSFLKTDYRGMAAVLKEDTSLAGILGLRKIPHFTTLQKASRRLLKATSAKRLLEATVKQQMGRRKRVPSAAIDSTGLQCGTASAYFVRRRKNVGGPWKSVVYHHFPKLGLVCDTRNHFILAFHAGRGPRPDIDEFRPLVKQATDRVRISQMTADAGYDSESNHRFAREEHRMRTMIPPKHGRPSAKPATGRYRRLMQTRFDEDVYHQRVQVETVMSMIKRRQGSTCNARSYWAQCRELALKALTHNIMILWWEKVFYRASRRRIIAGSIGWRKGLCQCPPAQPFGDRIDL